MVVQNGSVKQLEGGRNYFPKKTVSKVKLCNHSEEEMQGLAAYIWKKVAWFKFIVLFYNFHAGINIHKNGKNVG